ncbi:hypothetical protein EV363DRAFT_1240661 [Boletus edulis]|nr:hypothetical protein EV363DRAFT_1240661 [Boletus edulis]
MWPVCAMARLSARHLVSSPVIHCERCQFAKVEHALFRESSLRHASGDQISLGVSGVWNGVWTAFLQGSDKTPGVAIASAVFQSRLDDEP